MKKGLILLLCLMLMLPMAASAKTFGYTIPELMQRQLQNGGASLRVKVSAEATGEAIAGVDAQTWEVLKAVLPQLKLSGTYMQSKYGEAAGSQQLKTTLLKGEDALATLVLTGQQAQWYLESDLLPGKTYSLTRDLKEAFMHLSAPQEGAWPNILRLFTALSEGDEVFSVQLEAAMNVHMASLNRWLQGYTKVEITADQQLIQHISVPAADMKQQMKAFLKEVYADEALLALLRKIVPVPDAHAYLESGMLPLFEKAIDALQLEGEVEIDRAYAGDGQLQQEEITLPFGGGMPLRSLTIADGEKMALRVTLQDGSVYAVSLTGSTQAGVGVYEGEYAGEITVQSAAAEKAFEALYTLQVKKGMEQYLEENKSHERDQLLEAEMTLRSKDGESFAEQKLTASMHLTAGASSTKAAYANTVLVWQDMASGGQMTVHLDMNTNSGLRIDSVESELSVQTDTLNAAGREELLQDVSAQLSKTLQSLLAKIVPQDQP
ncbi:MAG: hypothetical protein IKM26_02525 [Clostridia bacterium]|nr:hypothetical protein [Clostridia bacterium]